MITDYTDKLGPEIFDIAERIKDISYTTLELLNKILDVSKIEAGIFEITLTKQDYLKFVKNHIRFNELLANKKEISIRLETNKEEILFDFDEHYMSEVINNLISNAIKFSIPKSEIV